MDLSNLKPAAGSERTGSLTRFPSRIIEFNWFIIYLTNIFDAGQQSIKHKKLCIIIFVLTMQKKEIKTKKNSIFFKFFNISTLHLFV